MAAKIFKKRSGCMVDTNRYHARQKKERSEEKKRNIIKGEIKERENRPHLSKRKILIIIRFSFQT